MEPFRDLYEQFKTEGIVLIERCVSQKWQESPLLDFKTVQNNAAPMTKDDRRNLAEALSGFANSEGGIIVWGIDARSPGSSEPDTARELSPIRNLPLFLSNLQRDTAHVVSPAIIGVEHFLINQSLEEDSGYAVTFVPKSQGVPHMARGQDQHRFYYRSGTSFLPMEPFMLADRYSRRPQPNLELGWRVADRGRIGRDIKLSIVIGIKNTGLGIALYPAIAIQEKDLVHLDEYGLDGNRQTGLPERLQASTQSAEARRIFAGGSEFAIHPNTTLDVTCITLKIPLESAVIPDVIVRYELYCQGFSTQGETAIPIYGEFRRIRGY